MGTLPKNKFIKFLLPAIIVALGVLVYILIFRPEQIKRNCYDYAYGTPNLGNAEEWRQATDYYYEACLHKNGL